MSEQAAAGWYPDGQGNERYWDGSAWTEQVRTPASGAAIADAAKRDGAFGKLGASVKRAVAEKKAAKEDLAREQTERAQAAGSLVTSGVFGTSTIEIYENGYVRVAKWKEGQSPTGPKAIDRKTPFEKLRTITFTDPEESSSASNTALEGVVGPAVAKLMKGGAGLLKASAPGMAAAGVAHLASNAARRSYLTITTNRQIHTLTNQSPNSLGIPTSNKGHNDVGRALLAAANIVLGVIEVTTPPVDAKPAVPGREAAPAGQSAITATLSERLRELASLHADGILSDDEFTAAKAKLLDGL